MKLRYVCKQVFRLAGLSTVVGRVLLALAGHSLASDREVVVNPGDDIQAMVHKSPPGTTFRFKAGTYRAQSIVPKDADSFIGEPGAILSGARLLSGITQQGQYWVAKQHVERSQARGQCADDAPGCVLPEDLFIDGQPLRHQPKVDDVASGRWHMDYDGDQLYLADDPTGHTVELSLARHAFSGSAKNVTIRGLIIEKYANLAQSGAINAGADPGPPGEGWVIEDNEVRFNHGAGIRFGNAAQVLHNNVHDNGQLGIGGSGRNVVVEGNEIAHNNFAGYNFGWEGGGTKFAFTNGLVVRNNTVHDNNGPGLWTDIDNVHVLYENNRTSHNKVAGIFHEISFDAIIRNNIIDEDGFNPKGNGPWFGAGIVVNASGNVEIYGNQVTNCMNGIAAIQPNRGSSKQTGTPYILRGLSVHDNVITQRQGVAAALLADPSLGDAPFTTSNNHFSHNTYRLSDPNCKCYDWARGRRNKGEWQAANQDRDGTW